MLKHLAAIISFSLVLLMAGHAFAAGGKVPGGGFDNSFVTDSFLRDQVVCCTGGEGGGEQMDASHVTSPCGVDLPCFALPGVLAIASTHGSGLNLSDSRSEGLSSSRPKEPPRPLS